MQQYVKSFYTLNEHEGTGMTNSEHFRSEAPPAYVRYCFDAKIKQKQNSTIKFLFI